MLNLSLPSPIVLRSDPAGWLRERGLIRRELLVYHPSAEHTTFRRVLVRVDQDGIKLPLRKPVGKGRARFIAETLIELHEAERDPIYLPCFDAELYEYLVAPTLAFLDANSNSNQTTTVPADWNSTNNFVDCIGAGGRSETENGNGGGGSAWARKNNLSLTPSASVTYRTGTTSATSGARASSWFNGTTFAGASVAAEGGQTGINQTGPAGLGGRASVSIGDEKFSGGEGATSNGTEGGGGGGCAGPNGAGGNAGGTGAGSANGGTTSGPSVPNKDGLSGTEYDSSHGCGTGGRGAVSGSSGGTGGVYGGGGGAGGYQTGGKGGGRGLVVLSYTPGGGNMMLMF